MGEREKVTLGLEIQLAFVAGCAGARFGHIEGRVREKLLFANRRCVWFTERFGRPVKTP